MSNMSYCRFQNTSQDLADCIEAIRDFDEIDEDYRDEEDGEQPKTRIEALSERERSALIEMIAQCAELLEAVGPDLISEAGVNLDRLA